MAIPITVEKLLRDNVVENERIEFKENRNPDSIVKTICAFANDIDNWGGGYILIGIKEVNGKVAYPISGIKDKEVDKIQKELLRYSKLISPSYLPIVEVTKYENKNVILIWCPGGNNRPYKTFKKVTSKNSEKVYFIRKFSSTIEANEANIKELISLTDDIPFDDRVNLKADVKDLSLPLIKNYLWEIKSNLLNNIENKELLEIAKDLKIVDIPKEFIKPLNVGLLFFNDDIEKFFPYCRIELVTIYDSTGQGMEERIFQGPIDWQLKSVLNYIKNNVIAEKVFKIDDDAEAIRIKNYPYEALEEFISNAVYHRSYQIHEPITIRVEKEQIEITSFPGPDRSITNLDLKNLNLKGRRYRNRRIGDFLKELHLVEGRNTGYPTAIRAIKNNGSPLPILETDEERTFFTVILPIHKAFLTNKISKKVNSEDKIKVSNKRKNKDEIKEEILFKLEDNNLSAKKLYEAIGYSGNVSKTFRECINDLIKENLIKYSSSKINSSSNLLIKIK